MAVCSRWSLAQPQPSSISKWGPKGNVNWTSVIVTQTVTGDMQAMQEVWNKLYIVRSKQYKLPIMTNNFLSLNHIQKDNISMWCMW